MLFPAPKSVAPPNRKSHRFVSPPPSLHFTIRSRSFQPIPVEVVPPRSPNLDFGCHSESAGASRTPRTKVDLYQPITNFHVLHRTVRSGASKEDRKQRHADAGASTLDFRENPRKLQEWHRRRPERQAGDPQGREPPSRFFRQGRVVPGLIINLIR